MAKTLLFEGCPTCQMKSQGSFSGLGALSLPADIKEYSMEVLQGSVAGAGVALITDIALSRLPFIGKIVPKKLMPIVGGLAAVGLGLYLRNKNPKIANGIAVGGMAIATAKLITTYAGPMIGLSGMEGLEVTEMSGTRRYHGLEGMESGMGAITSNDFTSLGNLEVSEVSGLGDWGNDEDTF